MSLLISAKAPDNSTPVGPPPTITILYLPSFSVSVDERIFSKFSLFDYLWVAPAILYTEGLYVIGKMVRILPYKWMLWLVNKPSIIVGIYTRLFGSRTRN